MQVHARLPKTDRQHVLAVLGFAASSAMAVLLLGVPGVAAAILFAPLLALTMVRRGECRPSEGPGPQGTRTQILASLSRFLGQVGHPTVALIVEIDDFDRLEEVYGHDALGGAAGFVQSAVSAHLAAGDMTYQADRARVVAALAPKAAFDLEGLLNTCTRIRHEMAEAPARAGLPMPITVSIGYAASHKVAAATGETLLQAAFVALSEARRAGPGAVRGYSATLAKRRAAHKAMAKDAQRAFEKGEIFAYFQPQISLSDGSLAGFEALTRWHHPEKGIVAPTEFLPALEQAGLMGKLGDTMIRQAVQALAFWDKSGVQVPRVGVNFSTRELQCPDLVDRIALHLDTGGIAPERLAIEVLETVVAGDSDDEIVANLAALADLGCTVDLDDFGTGYASITNIRRFSVSRIKIDRSFVAGLDGCVEQRSMIAAMRTMADRLGVTTLAEGVETRGELAALRDLGCQDAQGFQLARPMPLQETVDWAQAYFRQPAAPIRFAKRAS